MPELAEFKTFFSSLRQFGVAFALKSTLSHFGIKTYSTIRYPFVDINVMVRTSHVWKELERGHAEPSCIEYISKIVREGQTIFDVGAWLGMYTLLFSRLVGQAGRVYAFEPDPMAFDILRDNVKKNRLTNVRIEKIGLANSVGICKLRITEFGDSLSSLIERNDIGQRRCVIIETTTIDRYCEENDIHPDGIKIDVEGAEALTIEGCRSIIEKYSPWILLEFHGHHMPEKERSLNWHRIVCPAKEVVFVDDGTRYCPGRKSEFILDHSAFHVFIKY